MDVYVFSRNLEPIDSTDTISSGMWSEDFSGVGQFEFWAPLDEKHISIFAKENLVYMNEHNSAGVIEVVERSNDGNGIPTLHIAGRLLKSYLDRRCVTPTFAYEGTPSEVMREIVRVNAINPTDANRTIPNLMLEENSESYGAPIEYQQTGGSLLDSEISLAQGNGLGSDIVPNFSNKKLVYKIKQGINRTITQDVNDPVLLSTDMDSILSSDYSYDSSEFKNVAYVAAEGQGEDRTIIEVQNTPYTLKNLVANGGFENGFNGWDRLKTGITSVSEDCAVFNSHACKFDGDINAYTYIVNCLPEFNAGHIYYQSVWCKNSVTTGWGLHSGDNNQQTNSISTSHNVPISNNWTKLSKYTTIPNNGKTQISLLLYGAGSAAQTGTTYWDGALVVDLTKAFGAGNEPSQAWCDEHLDWFDGEIQMSMDDYIIYNQVPNGSFESSENYFSNSDMVDEQYQYGTRSLQVTSPNQSQTEEPSYPMETLATSTFKVPVCVGHKYYGSVYGMIDSDLNNALDVYWVLYSPYRSKKLVGKVTGNEWVHIDQVYEITSPDFYNVTANTRLDNNNNREYHQAWFDGFMIVDLTTAFGAGNEPDIEWCREHIKYFEGNSVVGNVNISGLDRRELYVDANSIQSSATYGDVTFLEYIESTGTQYIDTGIVPKAGYKAEIDFQATEIPDNNESWIFAVYDDSTHRWRCGFIRGSTTFTTVYGFQTYSQNSNPTDRTTSIGICVENPMYSVYLFGQNGKDVAGFINTSKYRLYSCKIQDASGKVIRDFSPAKRNSDGAIGLYDRATKKFFENAGTGEFESGKEITAVDDASYTNQLISYGREKLAEYQEVQSFEATIRTDDLVGFVFGKDYFVGDTITVYDSILKVRADVQITAAEYTYQSTGNTVELTLGYSNLTIMQKLKREVS